VIVTGFFKWIFGKATSALQGATGVQLLNSYDNTFAPYDGNAWNIPQVRAAVNAFAKNAAKVSPRHIKRGGGTFEEVNSNINRILRQRPNPYMTAFDMYYKVAAMYKLTNNAFIYPVWEGSRLVALYPILATRITLMEYRGELFCAMEFAGGKLHHLPYDELIHIRGHFYSRDVFGDTNKALESVLETSTALNESIRTFAKLISVVRGILKVKLGTKDENITRARDDFVRDNLRIDKNGAGVIAYDSRLEYEPIKDNPTPIPAGSLKYISDQINNYLGISEKIIRNDFREFEWNSFYEGELEPFFILLSQALTNGLFTEREQGHGNEIVAEANRLQYASVASKVSAVKTLSALGLLTYDQALDIFNMPPIGGEEGARRVQSLNFANTRIIDEYQSGKEEENDSNAES